jgi:hypothetical protein
MSGLADLKVGDAAVIVRPGRYGYETDVTVTKVARVYLTVRESDCGVERMFRIDTGIEKGSAGYGGSADAPHSRRDRRRQTTVRRSEPASRPRDRDPPRLRHRPYHRNVGGDPRRHPEHRPH